MNVGKSTAAKALIYLNNKLAIQGKDTWLRINDGKPFTSGVYFGRSLVRTDGTLQVGERGSALNVTTSAIQLKQPTTISSTLSVTGNSTLSTTSITTATVGQLNAQNTNVYGTLRAASYSIESVQNLSGHFLVCPTIEVPSAASGFSAQVTRTSSTQIRIAFTDNSLSTDTFNGTTWTPNSKVKVSGMINNIALGTCDGVIESWNKSSKVVTVLVTCGVATSFSTTATTYTSSQVSNLSIMMYELCPNPSTSDTTYRIGVYLTAYGENKYSYVDVYGGTSVNPSTRMGKLDGLPNVNNTAPTGWGFYSAQNGYFNGTIVADSGSIGSNVTIGGTKTVSTVLGEINDAAKNADNYIVADSNGLMVTNMRNGTVTPSTVTGKNVLIDSDSVDIRDGQDVVASFGEGVTIGQNDESHLAMDYHSLQIKDKEQYTFFHISDLRDENGYITEQFTGDGSTREFYLKYRPGFFGHGGDVNVWVDGVEKTVGDFMYANDLLEIYIPPEDGAIITVYYLPVPDYRGIVPTKAFTLGVRKQDSEIGSFSFAVGEDVVASGKVSHADGYDTKATGDYSYAEGYASIASGMYSHAEGNATASGDTSHAEGWSTASGKFAHSEGLNTTASGDYSHSEGHDCTASGYASHVNGDSCTASGDYQTVIGKYNMEDTDKAFIIGGGTADNARKNILTVDWDGIPSCRNPNNDFNTIFNLIYPVGSIYMSVNNVSPATLFGGTWERIQTGRFLVAAGGGINPTTDGTGDAANDGNANWYGVGEKGGVRSVTLGTGHLPKHTHTYAHPNANTNNFALGATHLPKLSGTVDFRKWGTVYGDLMTGSSGILSRSSVKGTANVLGGHEQNNGTVQRLTVSFGGGSGHAHGLGTYSANSGETGSGSAHENRPPYIAVYMWKRTA